MKSPQPMTSPPAALIFDWDGTLVDTLPGLHLAHNYVRTHYGFPPWTVAEFHQNLKYSSREIYPKIYGDKASEAIEILYSFVMENHLQHLTVLPHAEKLVRHLYKQGIPIGIVSNKRHEVLVREVEHLGWHDMFFCVLGAGQAARDKPAGDPVLKALTLAASPLEAGKVWFVGDTETDLLAAKAAGCPAILVTHGKDRKELINAHKPFIVADDCQALIRALPF